MIAIIDYDVGNLKNVYWACNALDIPAEITRDPQKLKESDAIILPGVGAFADAMDSLRKYDLIRPLNKSVADGKMLLGICLGMQLLFDKSYEDGEFEGLSYIPGEIVRFDDTKVKVPHIGWNDIIINRDDPFIKDIDPGEYVYYVHSYYAQPDDFDSTVITYSDYEGIKVPGTVRYDNVIGTQFHPEKSAETGLKMLKNFKEMLI
jgi:glutamine amidotransferase